MSIFKMHYLLTFTRDFSKQTVLIVLINFAIPKSIMLCLKDDKITALFFFFFYLPVTDFRQQFTNEIYSRHVDVSNK